jgi:hypothetical protein
METTIGVALLALYLVLVPVLFRLVRSPAGPAWCRTGLPAEALMLTHIALLVAGVILVVLGLTA